MENDSFFTDLLNLSIFLFFVDLVKIGEKNTKTDLGFHEKMTK